MNFIFGTRGASASPIQTRQSCPACGKGDSILMVPHQYYFHLFRIPLFPTTKHFTPVCCSCETSFTIQQFPVTDEIRNRFKTPRWIFIIPSVLALLIIFILVWVVVNAISGEVDIKDKVVNPQVGDVYYVRYEKNEYSLMKVASFTVDSIYFYLSPGRTEKRGLDMMPGVDVYDTILKKGFSKSELKSNSVKGVEILKIER
ncbi:hypothetical protein [Dysgonomonas mossii]|uniref:hypothetical protein n=1 Tax=Dysgonomonas mossii TaxID=163665 RepID=UPI0039969FF7